MVMVIMTSSLLTIMTNTITIIIMMIITLVSQGGRASAVPRGGPRQRRLPRDAAGEIHQRGRRLADTGDGGGIRLRDVQCLGSASTRIVTPGAHENAADDRKIYPKPIASLSASNLRSIRFLPSGCNKVLVALQMNVLVSLKSPDAGKTIMMPALGPPTYGGLNQWTIIPPSLSRAQAVVVETLMLTGRPGPTQDGSSARLSFYQLPVPLVAGAIKEGQWVEPNILSIKKVGLVGLGMGIGISCGDACVLTMGTIESYTRGIRPKLVWRPVNDAPRMPLVTR
jgi:hypothetical protein